MSQTENPEVLCGLESFLSHSAFLSSYPFPGCTYGYANGIPSHSGGLPKAGQLQKLADSSEHFLLSAVSLQHCTEAGICEKLPPLALLSILNDNH